MSQDSIQCPHCGNPNYKRIGDEAKCNGCGRFYTIESGKEFVKRCEESGIDLGKLRENVINEVSKIRINVEQVRQFCNEIKKVLPDDFLASFYLAYALSMEFPEDFINYLHRDLTDVDDSTLREVASFLVAHFIIKFERDIDYYLSACKDRIYRTDEYQEILQKISEKKKQLNNEPDRYGQFPRDVFICFEKNYLPQAYDVHEFLTKQNISHYFSAYNLIQTSIEDYWVKIRYAIEKAKVFVVISGYYTECVEEGRNNALKEMDIADSCVNLQRIEYKVDDFVKQHRTIKFERFFEHSGSWVSAGENEDKEIVFKVLYDTIVAKISAYDKLRENKKNIQANREDVLIRKAESGNAVAQCALGFRYETGDRVDKDQAKAAEWYAESAKQGYAVAQFNLGCCYEKGLGVGQDKIKAAELYAKAAEQGYAKAQNNLGCCYEKGIGIGQDQAKAAEWYTKAAKQGYANAQFNLALCYKNGIGVPQSLAEAVIWIAQAAKQGHQKAVSILNKTKE